MGRRIDYDPDVWKPGDPIWHRPSGSASGGYARPMVEVLHCLPQGPDCHCVASASWPKPAHHADLTSPRHVIAGLPLTLEEASR